MRKIQFANGEYYHIFNRGVEKREIFTNNLELERFFLSMKEFNILNPIGGLHVASFRKESSLRSLASKEKLVSFICYCLNPNHFHFILKQIMDRGIEKFMHRLGSGYTNYFNKKYKRSGSLFQGTFKANHINSDKYLLYTSAYVNLNNRVHQIKNNFFKSSWAEYIQAGISYEFCDKEIILDQFVDAQKYQIFAEDALVIAKERKELEEIIKYDPEST
ncbi:MAG: transposase [Patescibacteria group bacterium]